MQFPQSRLVLVGGITVALAILLYFAVFQFDRLPFHVTAEPAPTSQGQPFLQDVANQTLGFQKIFVISLPTRYDHRDSMTLAAAFSDLQIEYIDGVTDVDRDLLPPG
jgi:hypothetical protein